MQTRARRRLDMGLLAGGAIFAGGLALIGGVPAHAEEIDAIWTSAAVQDDGSALVTEVIHYDFGISTNRHGIFRVIPGVPETMPFEVTTDAPDDVVAFPSGGGTQFRIGDENQTVSGEHRYQLDYHLPGVVVNGVLDWETFGHEWEVTTNDAEVHVVAPFELDDPRCVTGLPGANASCDIETVEPGHVVARVDEVPAGEGISIEARQGAALASAPAAPTPPTEAPEEDGTGLVPPMMAAAGGTALAAFPVSRLVRRAGRERIAPGGEADIAFAGRPLPPPPSDYSQWTTRAGPYAPPGRPLPPPPGAPPPPAGAGSPVDYDGPDGPVLAPPPPGAPTAAPADADAGAGALRHSALGSVLRPQHHPLPPPPPAVGRIGPPVAGPPAWLPSEEFRIDEAELAEMATIEFAPPAELTPAQGGIVLEEAVKANHKAAWLVQAAIDGDVDIEESGQRATGLRRTGPGNAETARFLDTAFAGRGQVSLLKYDKYFSSAWSALGSQLSGWQRTSGLWDRKGDTRKVVWRVAGVFGLIASALAIMGAAFAANLEGSALLPVVLAGGLLGGASLAVIIRSWELKVRTAAGSGLWLRVESFRRFLHESEAYHAEEAARRGVLREYTAWALALGEIDRWRMAVMTATAIPPDTPGLGYVFLGSSIISSTSTAATAPSSSGSGGGSFGGGSVGGGAGGGGGGSW